MPTVLTTVPYASSRCPISMWSLLDVPQARRAMCAAQVTWSMSLALLALCAMCTASVSVWALAQLRKLWTPSASLWSLLGPSGRFRKPAVTRTLSQLNSPFIFDRPRHLARTREAEMASTPGQRCGGRGGDKDGPRKNALFAPQAFTTAEKKERHTLRTRALPLPLSQECDVR